MLEANYRFVKPQNDSTFHEHIAQGLHVVMGKTQFVFVNSSTPIGENVFPLESLGPMHNPSMFFGYQPNQDFICLQICNDMCIFMYIQLYHLGFEGN